MVTGADSGIGKITCLRLANMGAPVVVSCGGFRETSVTVNCLYAGIVF